MPTNSQATPSGAPSPPTATATTGPRTPITRLSEVKIGAVDDTGCQIRFIYALDRGLYAVYGTDNRLAVFFSDKPKEERIQRARLTKIQSLRGQINGLVANWRTSRFPGDVEKAKRFDRRGADALVLALEGHPLEAQEALGEVKRDILEDRTSWARFLYLIFSGVFVIAVVGVVFLATHHLDDRSLSIFECSTWPLFLAAAAGAIGAFFSIAIAIHNRTILTDQNLKDNFADAFLRILIGVLSAIVLMCLIGADIISFPAFKNTEQTVCFHYTWPSIVSIAFLAGFSERFVPDLLQRSEAKMAGPGGAPVGTGGPAGPAGGKAPAPAKGPAGGAAARLVQRLRIRGKAAGPTDGDDGAAAT